MLDSISLNSTTTTVGHDEPNGSYAYEIGAVTGYVSAPLNGNVTVNGSSQDIHVAFTPTTHRIHFTETGLPAGTDWSITLGESTGGYITNTTEHSDGPDLNFSVWNGSCHYSVGNVTGYVASPEAGSIAVDGSDVSITIVFTSSSSTSPPGTSYTWIILGTVAGVVVVAIVITALIGRKGRGTSSSSPSSQPPSTAAAWDEDDAGLGKAAGPGPAQKS
jgi:hypothetical protein